MTDFTDWLERQETERKAKQNEASRRSHAKHREARNARRQADRAANIERERARNREEYARNKEARKAASKRWKDAHPERTRELMTLANLRRYGLTPEAKEAMFNGQGRCCAACKGITPGSKLGWHVDHDHKTGLVRGILCHHCNSALGKVNDSVTRLNQLIAYLER